MTSGLDAVAGRFDDRQPDRWLTDEPRQQSDGVRSAADTGDREVRQAPLDRRHLGRRLIADATLEIADDGRIRMRTHR